MTRALGRASFDVRSQERSHATPWWAMGKSGGSMRLTRGFRKPSLDARSWGVTQAAPEGVGVLKCARPMRAVKSTRLFSERNEGSWRKRLAQGKWVAKGDDGMDEGGEDQARLFTASMPDLCDGRNLSELSSLLGSLEVKRARDVDIPGRHAGSCWPSLWPAMAAR